MARCCRLSSISTSWRSNHAPGHHWNLCPRDQRRLSLSEGLQDTPLPAEPMPWWTPGAESADVLLPLELRAARQMLVQFARLNSS